MKLWYYLSKALGPKAGLDNKEADIIALIRLVIVVQAFITNFVIIAGVWRHW